MNGNTRRPARLYALDSREELPEIRLTAKDREAIKDIANGYVGTMNVDQLMYLAGALEDAARGKRGLS